MKTLINQIHAAGNLEDIDAAFLLIQNMLGVASGDAAALFVARWESNNDLEMREFWHRALASNRREVLRGYIVFELEENAK